MYKRRCGQVLLLSSRPLECPAAVDDFVIDNVMVEICVFSGSRTTFHMLLLKCRLSLKLIAREHMVYHVNNPILGTCI